MERYSIKNQRRILDTHPFATDARPRSEWIAVGRQIIQGARPAFVLAPIGWHPDGSPIAFKECPVYDIKQTDPVEDLEASTEDAA